MTLCTLYRLEEVFNQVNSYMTHALSYMRVKQTERERERERISRTACMFTFYRIEEVFNQVNTQQLATCHKHLAT